MLQEHKIFIDEYGYISSQRRSVDHEGIYEKVFEFGIKMPMFIATQLTTLRHYEPTDDYVHPRNKKAQLSIMDAMETYRLMKSKKVKGRTARMVIPQATYIEFTLRLSLREIKSLYKRVNMDTYEYIRIMNNIATEIAPTMCKRLKINYVT